MGHYIPPRFRASAETSRRYTAPPRVPQPPNVDVTTHGYYATSFRNRHPNYIRREEQVHGNVATDLLQYEVG